MKAQHARGRHAYQQEDAAVGRRAITLCETLTLRHICDVTVLPSLRGGRVAPNSLDLNRVVYVIWVPCRSESTTEGISTPRSVEAVDRAGVAHTATALH